jgi:flagellar hook-length control protein FliK
MTNFPIASNNSQSPATGTQGDPSQTRNITASIAGDAAPTSQANSSANDQVAEPFSALLAQQISEADLSAADTSKIISSIHGKAATIDTVSTAKDVQDQTQVVTGTTSDQANFLAAVLLQMPVQLTDKTAQNTPMVDAAQPRIIPNLSRETYGIKQKIENDLKHAADKSREAENEFQNVGNNLKENFSAFIPLPSDAVKHMDMSAHSTSQSQTNQNTSKLPSSSTSPMMPNIVASNTRSDTAQTIATPLGNGGWADEFSQKIVWMNNQQTQIAELHLNPPDLGPLNVVLKLADNQLTAQFTSPHSAVRDAVENALPKLREILADNNIALGNATVSDQTPRDQGAEGFMNQSQGTAAQREAAFNATESNRISTATQSMPASRHNGMLDIFA